MRALTLTESQMQDYESYFGMDRDALIPWIAQEYGYFIMVVDDDAEVIYE